MKKSEPKWKSFSNCTSLEELLNNKDVARLDSWEVEKIITNFFSYEEEMNIGGKTHVLRVKKVMRLIAKANPVTFPKKRKKNNNPSTKKTRKK